MKRAVWLTVRALYGLETGLSCRSCDQPITTRDAFGRSEGVCHRCRMSAGASA
jgi:formamidopyrimidine-DNA glycosylase